MEEVDKVIASVALLSLSADDGKDPHDKTTTRTTRTTKTKQSTVAPRGDTRQPHDKATSKIKKKKKEIIPKKKEEKTNKKKEIIPKKKEEKTNDELAIVGVDVDVENQLTPAEVLARKTKPKNKNVIIRGPFQRDYEVCFKEVVASVDKGFKSLNKKFYVFDPDADGNCGYYSLVCGLHVALDGRGPENELVLRKQLYEFTKQNPEVAGCFKTYQNKSPAQYFDEKVLPAVYNPHNAEEYEGPVGRSKWLQSSNIFPMVVSCYKVSVVCYEFDEKTAAQPTMTTWVRMGRVRPVLETAGGLVDESRMTSIDINPVIYMLNCCGHYWYLHKKK